MMVFVMNLEDIRIVFVKIDSGEEGGFYFGYDVVLFKGYEDFVMLLDVDWFGYWVVSGVKDNIVRIWRVDFVKNFFECYVIFIGYLELVGVVFLFKVVFLEDFEVFKNFFDYFLVFLIFGF